MSRKNLLFFATILSFEDGEDGQQALKTALDGGLSQRCANVLVYATSNRRHLMPEYMDEKYGIHRRSGGEVHAKEAVEEKFPYPTDSGCS